MPCAASQIESAFWECLQSRQGWFGTGATNTKLGPRNPPTPHNTTVTPFVLVKIRTIKQVTSKQSIEDTVKSSSAPTMVNKFDDDNKKPLHAFQQSGVRASSPPAPFPVTLRYISHIILLASTYRTPYSKEEDVIFMERWRDNGIGGDADIRSMAYGFSRYGPPVGGSRPYRKWWLDWLTIELSRNEERAENPRRGGEEIRYMPGKLDQRLDWTEAVSLMYELRTAEILQDYGLW